MKAAVVDASVAIKWVAPEIGSKQALSLLTGVKLFAPAHWLSEAANGVWGKFHRGEWSADYARRRAAALLRAPVQAVPLADLLERALKHALALDITVYDSLYVALAEERGIPLVTDDRALLRRMASDRSLALLARPLSELPA